MTYQKKKKKQVQPWDNKAYKYNQLRGSPAMESG